MTIVNSKRIMTVEKMTQIDEKYLKINTEDYNCMAVVSSQTYNSDGVMFEYTQPGVVRIISVFMTMQ